MATQSRRGVFKDFDPDKMLPGEWAVVMEGDPNAEEGESVYMCFKAGSVKRMATYEDMIENIKKALADAQKALTGDMLAAADKANLAAQSADSASKIASAAADRANTAAENAENMSADVTAIKKILQDVLVVV